MELVEQMKELGYIVLKTMENVVTIQPQVVGDYNWIELEYNVCNSFKRNFKILFHGDLFKDGKTQIDCYIVLDCTPLGKNALTSVSTTLFRYSGMMSGILQMAESKVAFSYKGRPNSNFTSFNDGIQYNNTSILTKFVKEFVEDIVANCDLVIDDLIVKGIHGN